jgi:hypothetical protein
MVLIGSRLSVFVTQNHPFAKGPGGFFYKKMCNKRRSICNNCNVIPKEKVTPIGQGGLPVRIERRLDQGGQYLIGNGLYLVKTFDPHKVVLA